jgi:hypothetical protein
MNWLYMYFVIPSIKNGNMKNTTIIKMMNEIPADSLCMKRENNMSKYAIP